ncbi:hypothetical protein N0V90_006428 [Kalmusia sp. IMI 367209]|nr:hypothetical protein N0V90_006428 [Kalmusia sp. IMI 367209]
MSQVLRTFQQFDLTTFNLDLRTDSTETDRVPLGLILAGKTRLQRLCIQQSTTGRLGLQFEDSEGDSINKNILLRDLVLHRLNKSELGESVPAFSKFIDFSHLERLILWRCKGLPNGFLEALGEILPVGQPSTLKHLAIDIKYRDVHVRVPMDAAFDTMLEAFESLETLHLGWATSYVREPDITPAYLQHIGRTLEILSIHDYDLGHKQKNSNGENFVEWFPECPKIRQLGLQISGTHLMEKYWEVQLPFILSLGKLPELRTLHLRQSIFVPRTFNPQPFIDFIFNTLESRSLCKHLNVIIYGMDFRPDEEEIDSLEARHRNTDFNYISRSYFVKGQQKTNFDNNTRAVAVQVELPWLRDRVDDLEILDYDPEAQWMGGWPGWLRDE